MLTPEYLRSCTVDLEDLMEQLNQEITNDICRRIVKSGRVTESAKWQAKQAQEAGVLYQDLLKKVAESTGKTEAEIDRMFRDAGISSVRYDAKPLLEKGIQAPVDLSKDMQEILNAQIRKTKADFQNLAMTTATAGQEQFLMTMNEAIMKVESGAFPYSTALRNAIDSSSSIGAQVLYRNNRQLSVEPAIRMNLLTAVNQTANQITELNCERLGAKYVETTAHGGARPSHALWQGRVFLLEGGTKDYPNFYDATGYGTGPGLGGYNCRHSFYPFFPGISTPAYSQGKLDDYDAKNYTYNGENMTEYDASQTMRAYERAIRESKRQVNAYKEVLNEKMDDETRRALQDGYQEAKEKLKNRRRRMTDFCDQTGMEKDYLRQKVSSPTGAEMRRLKQKATDKLDSRKRGN